MDSKGAHFNSLYNLAIELLLLLGMLGLPASPVQAQNLGAF